ncbi:uncharacterized protein LOC133193750 [Saccostrea echinata]|uniref:uncharacterized protein LOC133193750 n=1 Tax=Saccostrea echinata TaxID=191078 RepID=UPI002A8113CC|nr:uncharacterized protein LOC133193750 [Saccostrea echinata]
MFSACLMKIKKEGIQTEHKTLISDADMKKLYKSNVFDTTTPRTLQQMVFFEIMMFFCNRGRQNLRNMKPTDFQICADSEGRRYVGSNVSRLTKNHREAIGDHDNTAARMYEKPGNPACPVSSFEKYISKLNPACEFL